MGVLTKGSYEKLKTAPKEIEERYR